jgi:hypothetical protein
MSTVIPFNPVSSGPSHIKLGERELELRVTNRAERALGKQREPLDIELELYFSCFMRKRVNFLPLAHDDVVSRTQITETVSISFRPVMTQACHVHDVAGAPDLVPLPLARPRSFSPKWLALDCVSGSWSGEFGY